VNPGEVSAALAEGAVVLDMRPPRPFSAGHLPGAVNLQFNRADLADRAEMVLPIAVSYVVHAEPEPVATAAERILREAGFSVLGSLAGGLTAWREAGGSVEELPIIDVELLHADLPDYEVVDAREDYEFGHAHIPGAAPLPPGDAWSRAGTTGGHRPLAVVCGDQVRSSLVASILLRHGRPAVLVFGGMVDWLDHGYEVERSPASRRG